MPDTRIAALQAEIASWREHDYMRSMSDDFWYSNGGHDGVLKEIRKIETQIREIEACHAGQ
jgi:hypothetical protein